MAKRGEQPLVGGTLDRGQGTIRYTESAGETMTRGSRKHVRDWTARPSFPMEFSELVSLSDCAVSNPPLWQPRGHEAPDEACLEDCGARLLPGMTRWNELAAWWLVHQRGANKPNWDLVVTCNFAGKPGLALIEAKAHEGELDWAGKRPPETSDNSVANHERIGLAIAEACSALDHIVPGVRISRDTHYQLANRVAYSWKLASMGVPVLLIYLGFTGDAGIADVGPPLRDDIHWRSVMHRYSEGVLPREFFDRWLPCGAAQMRMIVRSRPVPAQSPPRGS